ncbi:hypothetical protein SAMN02745116_02532 [Pilibacter termitis]|uniref:Uncharacterized protein n=1 Tax=Pilibacter termitis TaxID=263852 RepID=A0A1T4RC57_9ENTE|nr:hypothetical protein [Pilibacter termitis]SKA13553.1 hypothetical protein SAMN02745116_02532 [Pilibacter termitis]
MNVVKVIEKESPYTDKENLAKYYKISIHTLNKLIPEFRESKFCSEKGYRRPCYKVVIIKIDEFDEFITHKHKNLFR